MQPHYAVIRRFRSADIPSALDLWRATPGVGVSGGDEPASLRSFLRKNRALCLIAESTGRIVGTVLCGFDGRRGYIYHLAVRPEARRRGVARALISRVTAELSRRGAKRCHAMVFANNELAHAFWSAAGWRERGDIGLYSLDL